MDTECNRLYDYLKERIIGQDRAVKSVSDAFLVSKTIKIHRDTPQGVFLFLGPTGCGKTQTAKYLAEFLYGDENSLHIFNMSEFQTKESIGEFRGNKEDTKGRIGHLRDKHQEGIILFDEMEKAHPEFHDLFLQMFGEGAQISTYDGTNYSFKNFFFISTSNIGSSRIIYSRDNSNFRTIEQAVKQAFEANFRKEYVGRYKHQIVFDCLRLPAQRKIAEINLDEYVNKVSMLNDMDLYVDKTVLQAVLKNGIDRRFGARPLKNFIEKNVGLAIAKRLSAEDVKYGILTVQDGRIEFFTDKTGIVGTILRILEDDFVNLKLDMSLIKFFAGIEINNIRDVIHVVRDSLEQYCHRPGKLIYCENTGTIKRINIETSEEDFRSIFSFFKND